MITYLLLLKYYRDVVDHSFLQTSLFLLNDYHIIIILRKQVLFFGRVI